MCVSHHDGQSKGGGGMSLFGLVAILEPHLRKTECTLGKRRPVHLGSCGFYSVLPPLSHSHTHTHTHTPTSLWVGVAIQSVVATQIVVITYNTYKNELNPSGLIPLSLILAQSIPVCSS